MPNWATTRIEMFGPKEEIDRFLRECFTDEQLDFSRIVPFPEGFDRDLPAGSMDDAAEVIRLDPSIDIYFCYPWVEAAGVETREELRDFLRKRYIKEGFSDRKRFPTLDDLAAAYQRNIEVSGYKTWYEWCVSNWGTKWNASDTVITRLSDTSVEVTFDTAWGEPLPVLEAIEEMFPRCSGEWTARYEGDNEINGRRWYAQDELTEQET